MWCDVVSDIWYEHNWGDYLTSSVHEYFSLEMMALDNIGSTGNSAILRPSFVSSPLSFKAPSA